MSKFTDGVRRFASKMGNSKPHWPKRKPPVPKKQIDRWEGEGGSVQDDDDEHHG